MTSSPQTKTTPKTVLLVGHCASDGSYLRLAIAKADPEALVVSADDQEELGIALGRGVDLVLFNRELGYGFNDRMGVEVMRDVRERHPNTKMMLVSNYPEAQAAAVEAGAVAGFGKRELGSKRVTELLREALGI